MAKLLDQILVIDVESTCWPKEEKSTAPSEIIEIGLCLLDTTTLVCLDRTSILVKPAKSEVSQFCEELTGLSAARLAKEGLSFTEALSKLARFKPKERVWASWGDYDRNQFQKNCGLYSISYPFGSRHLNVKTLYSLKNKLTTELGMDRALTHAGLTLEGRHHSGVDDAHNIARLLATCLT